MNSRLPRTRNIPSRSGRMVGASATNALGVAGSATVAREAVRRNRRRFMLAKSDKLRGLPMSDERTGRPAGGPALSSALQTPHAFDEVIERLARLAGVDRQRHQPFSHRFPP